MDVGRVPKPAVLVNEGLLGMPERGGLGTSPARSTNVLRFVGGSGAGLI